MEDLNRECHTQSEWTDKTSTLSLLCNTVHSKRDMNTHNNRNVRSSRVNKRTFLQTVLNSVSVLGGSATHIVSAPDPHVTPAQKRVWCLTSEFLVVLSQHVRKTGKPIRLLDLKLSCDIKVVPHRTRMRGAADRI